MEAPLIQRYFSSWHCRLSGNTGLPPRVTSYDASLSSEVMTARRARGGWIRSRCTKVQCVVAVTNRSWEPAIPQSRPCGLRCSPAVSRAGDRGAHRPRARWANRIEKTPLPPRDCSHISYSISLSGISK